jgi:DNA (cytosine-5)-methyltransferase 1
MTETATAYYNENDPFAAAWLRELIKENLIAPGYVDERSIEDVSPNDLTSYTQHHFFAGIGGWSYALRLAGWPDTRPVWTGSAPCQPFSSAGKGKGLTDKRHLWPAFFWLIHQCRPDTIFGEQVSSKAGLAWLDIVASDLEAAGYGVGAFDLCAPSVGAFHIRQRLYFVADASNNGAGRVSGPIADKGRGAVAARGEGLRQDNGTAGAGRINARGTSELANPQIARIGEVSAGQRRPRETTADTIGRGGLDGLGYAKRGAQHRQPWRGAAQRPKEPSGTFWANAVWLQCRDGKARPTEPGIFPLAHGVPNRVGTLRGAGNAIVPELAAEFIAAYTEIMK